MKPCIDFLITQKCNYRCEYCSQSKGFSSSFEEASDEVIEAFLRLLDKTNKGFEVTISGGEPLCHEKFFYLVEEIVKRGFRVSVVSNFSFPYESYKKLKNLAGENLGSIFASLHLSQVKNLEEFLAKTKEFNSIKGNTDFTVGSVLSDENCDELKKCAEFFDKNGIKFELQHMRIKNEYVNYGKAATDFIEKFPISKIKKLSNTYGKMCDAGVDFLFIYQNGEAYRCYSSRFNKVHSLGNIKDKNFKMYEKPLPCLNKNCTCPKPIINGMIDYGTSRLGWAFLLSTYNLLFLPYYFVKNRKILGAKIKQWKKIKKQG